MKTRFYFIVIVCSMFLGCKKYLDAKPDKKLAIPATIADLWALLDNYTKMNMSSPRAGEEYADTYYLTATGFKAISNINTRNNYIWNDKGELFSDWVNAYSAIFYANVVLDEIDDVAKNEPDDMNQFDAVRGSALFFRTFMFYELAQIFAPQYAQNTLSAPCIPLRLNPDPAIPSVRATVSECYSQMINDLRTAARLLPENSETKNRPSKAAAFGLLGRIYLNMGDYKNAALYADSCLQIYSKLIDYNTLSPTAAVPIPKFNEEVIFASRSFSESSLLYTSRCRIDTVLYRSYAENDLRKDIFFKANTDGSFTVKASYDGSYGGAYFNGLATDEQYLILAECYARLNNIPAAEQYLNLMLEKRFLKGKYQAIEASTSQQALDIVLSERRKELVFRGVRWSDIRRLNKEDRYRIHPVRKLDNELFELKQDDNRYISLIPLKIIEITGLPQNER